MAFGSIHEPTIAIERRWPRPRHRDERGDVGSDRDRRVLAEVVSAGRIAAAERLILTPKQKRVFSFQLMVAASKDRPEEAMKKVLLSLAAAAAISVAGTPVLAHHSANAQFDTSKEKTLSGVLVEMKDINPHSRWFVDVKAANGQVEHWEFEGVSPTALRRQGVKVKEEIKAGETYEFTYAPAWDGSKTGLLTAMVINGRHVQYVKV